MPQFDRRRFLQTGSLLLAGGYAGMLWGDEVTAAPAFAEKPSFEPTALFLTWQRDPTTTMTIQWIGDERQAADHPIWYAPAGNSKEWRQQAGVTKPYPLTDQKIVRTELVGLAPDTEYTFRVGLDSAEQRFRTMPSKATNTIHFVSGGDAGIGVHPVQTNHIAAAQAPQFVVIGGDLAYENGRDANVFLEFLKNYSRDVRDKDHLIPMLGCIGNHEVNGGYEKTRKEAPFFYSIFDGLFPETGYACLDFGDYLSLILLDTNHTTPIEGAQTDWLAQTLKDREECPTVFAFNHVPAYPSFRPPGLIIPGDKGTGTGNREHWVPLFERYNVDAVFEHHDHTYKRTHPLLGGHTNKNGIVYLGDGSWGKIRKPAKPDARPYLAVTDEAYHLSVHRIEGEDRFHVALSDTGRVVDVCATKKRPRNGGRA